MLSSVTNTLLSFAIRFFYLFIFITAIYSNTLLDIWSIITLLVLTANNINGIMGKHSKYEMRNDIAKPGRIFLNLEVI